MKKIGWFIAYASVALSIYIKTLWMVIAQSHDDQKERATDFFATISESCLLIAAILSAYSLYIFISRFNSFQNLLIRILNGMCIAILTTYLFLEVLQFLWSKNKFKPTNLQLSTIPKLQSINTKGVHLLKVILPVRCFSLPSTLTTLIFRE